MAVKKREKTRPKKMSLKDRLAHHWEAGNWEAFVSLYLRDRAASEQSPWAARYVDALYNCLTQSLFIHQNRESARELAGLLLEAGARDDIARDCALVTLDYLTMRQEAGAVPSSLAAEDQLPEPWRALRAGLRQAAADGPRKRGRQKKSGLADGPAGAWLEKLTTQFQALARARNLRLFSSFRQTAEALEKETAALPGADVFTAVRAIAELLWALGGPKRGGDGLRDLSDLQSHQLIDLIPRGVAHPAVLRLWHFFCERGEMKFGSDWAAAARVLRLRFDRSHPELATAFQSLFRLDLRAPSTIRLFDLQSKYAAWSEPELYILQTAFCIALHQDGPGLLADIGGGVLLRHFRRLTVLGRRWRPANPWPRPVNKFFELMVNGQGPDFLRALNFDLPYESLTGLTLALMTVRSAATAKLVLKSAGPRLPLRLSAEEVDVLAFDLATANPGLTTAADLKKLLGPESLVELLAAWVRAVVEISAVNVRTDGSETKLAWDSLPPDLLVFMIENLPEDEPAGLFIRLGLRRPYRTLSEDPQELAAFSQALARVRNLSLAKEVDYDFTKDDDEEPTDGFAGNLFIMLTNWPGADLNLMLDLFRLGQRFLFRETDLWGKAVEAVGLIKNVERRQALARGLFGILKTAVDPERREARRCFNNLQKGQPAKLNPDRFKSPIEILLKGMEAGPDQDPADDFQEEMMKKFDKLMGWRRKS